MKRFIIFLFFLVNNGCGSAKELCQPYAGETCASYLNNQTVFVAPDLTMEVIEERLKAAYGVIGASKYDTVLCLFY